MNILPTGPHVDGFDPDYSQYFRDLKRWNFDIAYNAHYAFSLRDTRETYAESYRKFVRGAREAQVPCCIQIQSTVAHAQDVPFTETQRYADNQFYCYEHFEGKGKVNHFGSFASSTWLEHQKKLARIFRDFGFDWVVFEEPMLHTDIPGTEDPIYRVFRETYPDLEYPTHQAESPAYLALQSLKRDVLTRFYQQLADYSKSIGYSKVGIMPWFFSPTFENTPAETWATSCDIGRVTFIENMDFAIVRMQPDNIHAQAMISSTGESRPTLAYYECLAHNLGKSIIMVNNPTDEHRPEWHGASPLIPLPFFTKYTLAAVAASPQGMSRHWYGKEYDEDSAHMDLMTQTNDLLRRLGPATAQIAFVFSYSGTSHVWPRPWREVWRTYWCFAQHMVEQEHTPFLTFFAETLEHSLVAHPEVTVVVLNEYFPLPPSEVDLLGRWVAADTARRIVYTAGHDGYRWQQKQLHSEYRMFPPEMAALVGIDTTQPVRIHYPDPEITMSALEPDDAQLGPTSAIRVTAICRPQFGDDVKTVYQVAGEVPVVTVKPAGSGGKAWFVGVALESPQFHFPLAKLLRYLAGVVADPQIVRATQSIFHNVSRSGYFVIANCAESAGHIELQQPLRCWDVDAEKLVKFRALDLPALTIKLFRRVDANTLLLDIRNAILVQEIIEAPNEVLVRGMFHSTVQLVLQKRPKSATGSSSVVSVSKPAKEGKVWRIDVSNISLQETELRITF